MRPRLATFRYDQDHYLNTPEGLLARYRRRRARRRIRFSIEGVEPRAKGSMPDSDKDEVQRQLLDWLIDLKRRAFTGPLALRMMLRTTDKAPTHSHNIAKNLLDLFARPRTDLATRRHALLYADDHQVHALSVTCHHGESEPGISVVASPLGNLIEDLDLVMKWAREEGDHYHDLEEEAQLDRALDDVNDMVHREADYRRRFGDAAFDSLLRCSRQRAQEYLLGRAALRPFDLASMYNVSGRGLGLDMGEVWERIFASTPLRILLSELPQVRGTSAQRRQEIEDKLRAFQARFGWLIDPLLVPVALEVVIKPPPPSRHNALHDLDNVLRSYLIPRVVEILKPVSHYAFTVDLEAMRRDAPDLFVRRSLDTSAPNPPASTRAGVTRYEAWRLPPAAEGSAGFVAWRS